MKAYKGCLFDLDGTLLDSSDGIFKSIDYILRNKNVSLNNAFDKRKLIGPPIYESFIKYCGMNSEEAKIEMERFRQIYKDKYLFDAKIYDGIKDILEKLNNHDIKLAVATNKRYDYAKELLQYFDLNKFFQYIEGSGFNSRGNKEDIIQTCINKMHLSNADVVMIGDTMWDYNAAYKVGIDFIPVTYGFGFKEETEEKLLDKVTYCKHPKELEWLLNLKQF